jgi:endonuclease G
MYTGTGFDRGHLCPSGDRTSSDTDNAHTFLMTNMTPQAPNMNEITWEAFETYCRTLVTQGYELYIIAGGYGTGGSGSNGGTTNTISSGSIGVPSHFWKVAVILPVGINDVSRITTATRVIAIDMPNTQSVNTYTWDHYRTSVDAIEAATGYDFLSVVPTSIQSVIEASVDAGPTH